MSCAFYNDLGNNPTNEAIERWLIKSVAKAESDALSIFKQKIKNSVIQYAGDVPDNVMELIFISHTSDIMYALEDLFEGEDAVIQRVGDAIENPALIGVPDANFDSGFYHAGFAFAIYWYGITGTEPTPSLCVTLNRAHAMAIEQTLEEIAKELDGKKSSVPSTSSTAYRPNQKSWCGLSIPALLIMFAIGLVIGFIIYLANQ